MRVRLIVIVGMLLVFCQAKAELIEPSNRMPYKDTIKISRDSLFKIIQMKDSMLLQASLDSLAMSNLLELIWWEKDSLQAALQNLNFELRQDSLYKEKRDSIIRERNRTTRWNLRDSIYRIEEDSVKWHLAELIENVYSDSSRIQNPEELQDIWMNLVYHLGNDSTYFWIHFADRDSMQVVLKNDEEVTAAIFLTNEQADSAKVYLRGDGKHSLHMYLDEGVFLRHALKRSVMPDRIDIPSLSVSKPSTLNRKKNPTGLPKYWNLDSYVMLSINQIAFSNWAKSGDNQLSLGFESKGSANYQKGKKKWNNNYWYRYGTIKLQDQPMHKNLDLMKANSQFSQVATKDFSYTANLSFDGQLFKGYRSPGDSVPISQFLSPGQIILGIGLQYNPNKVFTANLQPVSQKFTFVLDTVAIDPARYKIPAGKKMLGEPGATLTLSFKKTIWKNIVMDSNLRLFSSYFNNPEKVDVDFTTNLSLRVNKYMSTSLFIHAIYDDDVDVPIYEWIDGEKKQVDVGKRVQIMERFGIVFKYYL